MRDHDGNGELDIAVVGKSEVAVGALVAAEDVGDGHDSFFVINLVEYAPVSLAYAMFLVAVFKHSPRARLGR